MADGSWYFSTHVGFLYRIQPPPRSSPVDHSAASISRVSWLHPNGQMYIASLFTSDGADTILALSHNILDAGATGRYQWLTLDLKNAVSRVAPFTVQAMDDSVVSRMLLYGSSTRDSQGNHYVVGIASNGSGGEMPIVLRVMPRKR